MRKIVAYYFQARFFERKNSTIMAVAMVAMLAFGGTYAYFTATTEGASTTGVTTAKVALGAVDGVAEVNAKNVVSGTELFVSASPVKVTNTSDVKVWVIVNISCEINGSAATYLDENSHDALTGTEVAGLYLNVDATSWKDLGNGYYGIKTEVEAATNASLPLDITFYANTNSTFEGGKLEEGSLMGQSVKVTITAEAIQAYDVADIDAAFAALGHTAG